MPDTMKRVEAPELLAEIASLVRDRRITRHFFGRRSLDKTHGEVVHDTDPAGPISDETMVVVEIIDKPNFLGEYAAEERAGELSDEWTAQQIIDLLARTPSPQIAGLVSALEQGARWFEEYAVDHAVKARQAPSYAEQGAREDKAKRNQERAEFLRNAATFRGDN